MGELILASEAWGIEKPEPSICRYDPTTGKLLGELLRTTPAAGNSVAAAVLSADRKKLAMTFPTFAPSERPKVVIIDTTTAAVLHRFDLPDELSSPSSLLWMPDDRQLLVGSDQPPPGAGFKVGDNTIFPKRLLRCDLTSGQTDLISLTAGGVQGMALTPDGKLLVLLDRQAVCVRDAATLRLKYRIPLEQSPGNTIAVSHDGRRCAVAYGEESLSFNIPNADFRVMIFDLTNGSVTVPSVAIKDGIISALTFTPDGSAVVCGTSRGNVKVLSATDGSVMRTISVVSKSATPVSGVFVPASGKEVVASMVQIGLMPDQVGPQKQAARVRRYSLATGEVLGDLPGEWRGPFVHPDNTERTRMTVFDPYAGTVRLFDPAKWDATLFTYKSHAPKVEKPLALVNIVGVAVSPDGKRVVIASSTGEVAVFSHPDGQQIGNWKLKENNLRVVAVRFSPDNKAVYLAGAAGRAKEGGTGQVVRLDLETGQTRVLLTTPPLSTFAKADIYYGDLLLLISDGTRFIVGLKGPTPPDGEVIVVYSLDTGEEVARRPLLAGSKVVSMAYHPPTQTVVAHTSNRIVDQKPDGQGRWVQELHVWPVVGRELRTLEVETTRTGPIGRVAGTNTVLQRPAISPDGRLVAFRSFSTGTVKLVELSSSRTMLTLPAADGYGPLLFTPDGRTLLNLPEGRSAIGYRAAQPK